MSTEIDPTEYDQELVITHASKNKDGTVRISACALFYLPEGTYEYNFTAIMEKPEKTNK